jgi:hypothetical protein
MTFGGMAFWIVNSLLLVMLIFKFKSISKLKKCGIFMLFFASSLSAIFFCVAYLGEPSLSAVEKLTLNYVSNAKNIKIMSIAEDKTKGKSYIVTAVFTDGEKNCVITMPVTRTSGIDSWHASNASINDNN